MTVEIEYLDYADVGVGTSSARNRRHHRSSAVSVDAGRLQGKGLQMGMDKEQLHYDK